MASLSRAVAQHHRRVRAEIKFQTAQAINEIAEKVASAEEKQFVKVLNYAGTRPTPFTLKSIRVRRAGSNKLFAVVWVKPIAEKYLAPFEFGGTHDLGKKKCILYPEAQPVNAFGNLPAHTIERLKLNPNVFVGQVMFGSHTMYGVWLRPRTKSKRTSPVMPVGRFAKNKNKKSDSDQSHVFVSKKWVAAPNDNRGSAPQLLIKMAAPHQVNQRLLYFKTARDVTNSSINKMYRLTKQYK